MKSAKFAGVAVILSLSASVALADALMSQSDAFDYGKNTGSQTNVQAIQSGISDTQAASVISGYDPNALPSGAAPYDGGLLGTLTTVGTTKINNCGSGNAGGTDQASTQHCEAVNAVNQQANMPPQTVLNNADPLFTVGDAIKNNPQAIAGSMVGNYSSCTTKTITSPPNSSEEACIDYSTVGNSNCSTGTQVVIDGDHFYKCVETIATQSNSLCVVGQKVVVDGDTNYQCQTVEHTTSRKQCQIVRAPTVTQNLTWNCVPGTFTAQVGSGCLTSNCDQLSVGAYCDPGGRPQIGVFAAGVWRENWGRNCGSSYSGRIYSFDALGYGSYSEGMVYSTNWHKCDNQCCYLWGASSIVGQGCSNGTCTATVSFAVRIGATCGKGCRPTYAYPSMTITYPQPSGITYTYGLSENNQCSVYESQL